MATIQHFTFDNPVFAVYSFAASIMLLKLMLQPWLTVYRMRRANGGFRNPEDLKPSRINPTPHPAQIEHNEYVDRSRRIQQNDLESIPGFLFAGLLFVLADPSLLLAQILFAGYVIARGLHFFAYLTARLHDTRVLFWTPGSIAVLIMIGYVIATLAARL